MRLTPSERTRKFALPKLRIARIRPPAVVSIFGDSSASADFAAVRLDQRRDAVGPREPVRVGRHAKLAERVEMAAAVEDQLVALAHDGIGPAAISPRSMRRFTVSSTPLTNGTASSVLKRRVSSSASSMTTAPGVEGSCSSS